ncbi:hypothetical protein VTK56DRAFT_7087 [Thermocarpiscus australiensis]
MDYWLPPMPGLPGRFQRFSAQWDGTSGDNDMSTTVPFEAVPFMPTQGFNTLGSSSQHAGSQTKPYLAGHTASSGDSYVSTRESSHPLSPSTTHSTVPSPLPHEQRCGAHGESCANASCETSSRSANQPSANNGSGRKEPYFQLISRALRSTPEQAMTLREIYQWFVENTDKGKDGSKGWKNSIRYNLSMNEVRLEFSLPP